MERQFQSQSSDVLLISIPKSGTAWLKALMFALINRKNYPINQSHPLLTSNPHHGFGISVAAAFDTFPARVTTQVSAEIRVQDCLFVQKHQGHFGIIFWITGKKPHKVLFVKYEDVKEEPALYLKRIAEFIGCPISPEEETSGLIDEILRLCSFDSLRNLEVNKTGKWMMIENQHFIPKAEVGDWKNHLTNEMALQPDQITSTKFEGSGFIL
ncbi:cytosolic sulfotransferase 11-like [Coffea eugenioides]|uniref:cytosolic sulfotransferase 11-like n=1 Tax=Coffea eugenioides TaxID=49369 RepID=UPI000F60C0DB|nr:cytosolic sulfotransferase 11-like [Coffea eugenioides]